MNIITSLLDIEDNDLGLLSCEVQGLKKIVTLGNAPTPHFCPKCSCKIHSRGIKTRTINHTVLQVGYQLVIKLKQRRWRCTNSDGLYEPFIFHLSLKFDGSFSLFQTHIFLLILSISLVELFLHVAICRLQFPGEFLSF